MPGRRNLIHRAGASLCVSATAASVALLVLPTAVAHAASCTAYEFIGARGSGDTLKAGTNYDTDPKHGLGGLLSNVYTTLSSLVGQDQIDAYGVHYPAVGLTNNASEWANAAGAALHIKPLGAYTDSVRAGTADAEQRIATQHAACPGQRFVLAGYSQGASRR